MKAICVVKPNEIAVLDREVPQISRPEDVLIKIKCVGICGSDVHVFHGTNPFASYPRVWGHEFTGEVVAVGEGVTDLVPGDHVVGEPFDSCGSCYACRHGRGNVCEEISVFGVHQDGGCQEYRLMTREKVHKIDNSLPWDIAVLAEPLTIGFQATSRGRVEAGDLVLIMGAGTIGSTLLMAAKAKGATVIITDLVDAKLDYAKKLGADYTVNVRNQDLSAYLKEQGMKPNVVLDAVGMKFSLEQAVDVVSAAGRVVELGFDTVSSSIPHVTVMKKEVDVCGTRLQSGQFPAAVSYIEKNHELLNDFVTQKFSVSQTQEAFRFVTEHNSEVRKAIIMMEQ